MDEQRTGCCACTHKTKARDDKEIQDLFHRLNRIEGQIRGIRGMVERDAYCTDILTQVAAVSAAMNSFTKVPTTSAPAWRTTSARGATKPSTSLWRRFSAS